MITLLLMVVMFFLGVYYHRWRNTNYKTRWKELQDIVFNLEDGEKPGLPPTSDWRVETRKVKGHYNKNPSQQVDLITIDIVKGKERINVTPFQSGFALDPASNDFESEMKAYKKKAEAAARLMT